ncbi:MAG: hypothetical protein HYY65_06940 [Candidatus Tectomicrobia bacterium]|uniref:Uncharacterized protein n=1 Tax=Tectimicrobiota bacterium TaxID=2528274 RepID=A0A932M056_UNCTE|nr:hypothetical protein [Candidatus Tectomicrobia bacterium]
MGPPFEFYSETGIRIWTGIKADNLKSLLEAVRTVSGSAIFYHMHHSLFRRHFTTSDYMNDFARWVFLTQNQEVLAEKLASIDPWEYNTVREVREVLVDYLGRHIGEGERFDRIPAGSEFFFLEQRSALFPTGLVAANLKEFLSCLKYASRNSLFFHLVEARIRLGRKSNDFSEWLGDSLGESELARRIASISPYQYNLWGIKEKILSLVGERLADAS